MARIRVLKPLDTGAGVKLPVGTIIETEDRICEHLVGGKYAKAEGIETPPLPRRKLQIEYLKPEPEPQLEPTPEPEDNDDTAE